MLSFKNRYAITIQKGPVRGLLSTNQGRFHFDQKEDAEAKIQALKDQSSEVIDEIFGEGAHLTLKATETPCYSGGDSALTIFPL